jgi:phosphomannomutase
LFAHNPEPLPEHLGEIAEIMIKEKADVGFTVDPDVDRLAIINDDGTMFGEEYTLVSVADYILSRQKGNTVSNLSSTGALKDITEKYGGRYFASPVGEVNVVAEMKRVEAVIGGEGNGGVILPELHYGRDALIGIALFLTHLAEKQMRCSELRRTYPDYFMIKNKIEFKAGTDVDALLNAVIGIYKDQKDIEISAVDGVKLIFKDAWVHLRKSNTEPIIRIYAESRSREIAAALSKEIIDRVYSL